MGVPVRPTTSDDETEDIPPRDPLAGGPRGGHVSHVPPGLLNVDHPSRAQLRVSLADLYRLAPREGYSLPPGARPVGVGDSKQVSQSSVGKYIWDQAGRAVPKATARSKHRARGSRALLSALSVVRSSLSSMLLTMADGATDPLLEEKAANVLATALMGDFNSARSVAEQTPRVAFLGTTVSASTLDAAGGAARYVGHLMLQALVIGAAVYFGSAAYHDPGM